MLAHNGWMCGNNVLQHSMGQWLDSGFYHPQLVPYLTGDFVGYGVTCALSSVVFIVTQWSLFHLTIYMYQRIRVGELSLICTMKDYSWMLGHIAILYPIELLIHVYPYCMAAVNRNGDVGDNTCPNVVYICISMLCLFLSLIMTSFLLATIWLMHIYLDPFLTM